MPSWDTLSSHKGVGVQAPIEATGATLLVLPPGGPDFNPIENVFAKRTALLRKAAEQTVEGPWSAIGRIRSVHACRVQKRLHRRWG